tara:strand:+ start:772 stop:912 length:141 start_codon:yes stop_codon:yes gene_type:complete
MPIATKIAMTAGKIKKALFIVLMTVSPIDEFMKPKTCETLFDQFLE